MHHITLIAVTTCRVCFQFSFDYSYWSHDGFNTTPEGILEPQPGSMYASQRIVFNDLGNGVLKNAFEGKTKVFNTRVLQVSHTLAQISANICM